MLSQIIPDSDPLRVATISCMEHCQRIVIETYDDRCVCNVSLRHSFVKNVARLLRLLESNYMNAQPLVATSTDGATFLNSPFFFAVLRYVPGETAVVVLNPGEIAAIGTTVGRLLGIRGKSPERILVLRFRPEACSMVQFVQRQTEAALERAFLDAYRQHTCAENWDLWDSQTVSIAAVGLLPLTNHCLIGRWQQQRMNHADMTQDMLMAARFCWEWLKRIVANFDIGKCDWPGFLRLSPPHPGVLVLRR